MIIASWLNSAQNIYCNFHLPRIVYFMVFTVLYLRVHLSHRTFRLQAEPIWLRNRRACNVTWQSMAMLPTPIPGTQYQDSYFGFKFVTLRSSLCETAVVSDQNRAISVHSKRIGVSCIDNQNYVLCSPRNRAVVDTPLSPYTFTRRAAHAQKGFTRPALYCL